MERLVASTARAPIVPAVPLSVWAGRTASAAVPAATAPRKLGDLLRHVGKERVDELVDEVRIAPDHLEQIGEGGLVQHLRHRTLRWRPTA